MNATRTSSSALPPARSRSPWTGSAAPLGPVPGLRYRPALDGIRALAVLAVVAYHLGYPLIRGGYLGVDVFFVLSGFLITSLLLTEFDATGRIWIDLVRFWGRRARRLLPAIMVLLVCIALWEAGTAAAPSNCRSKGAISSGRCSTGATGT